MFQDLEIIIEPAEIIYISDDDVPLEEDNKDSIIKLIPTEIRPDNELNNISIAPAGDNNVFATEPERNIQDSNVVDAENLETHGSTNPGIVLKESFTESTNNTSSNIIHMAKRKRQRLKKNANRAKGKTLIYRCKKVVKNTTIEKESNSNNNVNANDNINSANFEEATCSSSVITPISRSEEFSDDFDYSKLQWLKPISSLSSPPHLQIVIIDRGHPYYRISNDMWLMLEKRLLEALNSEMLRSNNSDIGLFDGAKWQRGIKIIGCHNKNAFDFIMKFIISVDSLWRGASLHAFPLPNATRHVVKGYIPPPTLKREIAMSLIKLQNPSIDCEDWKIIREVERANGGIDVWINVNDESFKQIRRLRGEIKFGINRIWLRQSNM